MDRTTILVIFLMFFFLFPLIIWTISVLGIECFVNSNQYGGKEKLSAIVMNHSRPQMAKKLVEHLSQNVPHIDEILLINNKAENAIYPPNAKIIDGTGLHEKYGVRVRFIYGSQAKNKYVLFLDDDFFPDPRSVSVLLGKIVRDPSVIHGTHGRSLGYRDAVWEDIKTLLRWGSPQKENDIVLTKCLVVDKDYLKLFEDNAHLVDDFAQNSPGAKWNGEDIFLNLVVRKHTGRRNMQYILPFKEKSNGIGISKSNGHLVYRRKFISIALSKLGVV